MLLGERVRRQVEQLDLGELGHVTVSIGVARLQPDESRKALIARADKAMYAAKSGGRNRVASDP